MKKPSWSDSLSAVTRGIIVFCGILLVVSAIVTMMLMFFPIQREDHPTVVVEPVRHTEYSATTRQTTTVIATTTTPHTLSTWNAGITGFNPNVEDHIGTQDPRHTTMDPRLIRKETTTLAPGKKPSTETLAEGEIPFIMPRTAPRPETTTVTTAAETVTPAEEDMTAPMMPDPMS